MDPTTGDRDWGVFHMYTKAYITLHFNRMLYTNIKNWYFWLKHTEKRVSPPQGPK